MSYIREVEIYDLKNSQKSKLICLKLDQVSFGNSFSLILLSYSNN